MSACFEAYLLSRSRIPQRALPPLFSVFGADVRLERPEFYPDWTLDAPIGPEAAAEERRDCIRKQDGMLDAKHRIGVYQYWERGEHITQLWIDTAHLTALDTDDFTPEMERVCRALESRVRDFPTRWGIHFFAAGCEVVFHSSASYEEILLFSRNLVYSCVF